MKDILLHGIIRVKLVEYDKLLKDEVKLILYFKVYPSYHEK